MTLGWQPHQVVCRPKQCLSSILVWLTTKTAKIMLKARAHSWVHAEGFNVLSQIIAVLGILFSLNEFPGLPRLNVVWSLHPYWSCLDVNGSTQFPSQCNPSSLLFTWSTCTVEVLSWYRYMMTMLYQGGSCVSGKWLLVVVLTVLMYALPLSHGMQFMPRFLA